MREEQASLTATAVALARAAHAPTAASRALLPRPSAALSGLWAAPGVGRPLRMAADVMSGGLVTHLRLRTAAIDAAVTDAIDGGATQLVLLGAGLDARAHRLANLGDVTVWEVDHPATQASKRRRARLLEPAAAAVHYVPVNFSVDDLALRLREAGLPPHQKSVWVWEGVTMYLPTEATRATLAAISQLAPDGSTLAMTYMVPKLLRGAGARVIARSLFGLLGEPLIGAMSPNEARARVDDAGFHVMSDTGARAWATAHGGHWLASALFGAERLLVSRT